MSPGGQPPVGRGRQALGGVGYGHRLTLDSGHLLCPQETRGGARWDEEQL